LERRVHTEPAEDRVEGRTVDGNRIRVNEEIGVSPVRLIDYEGGQVGVVSLEAARMRAAESGLDLVEVSPESRPPVVRLMDSRRFRSEGRRRAAEGERQQAPVKEVRFRPGIEAHEYEFKARHIRRFIGEGYRVAVTMRPDDRTGTSASTDEALLERLRVDLEDVARAESGDPADGPPTIMTLTPFTRE
jgi:translation initiation factor IF-3